MIALLLLSRPTGVRTLAASKIATVSRADPGASKKGLGDHYLMLVNSAIASMMDDQKIEQFGRSPYDGLAVAFSSVYDTAPVPSTAAMRSQITRWQKITTKDFWPWVYLNRMIAVDDGQHDPHTLGNVYFHRIEGADLDDKTGAEKDLLRIWENSLRVARETRAPGVVCDLEFYNYYKEYDPTELARQMGKKPQEVIDLLKALGSRMADVAATQYPDATLWFLFTGFAHPGYKDAENRHYFLSSTYIAIGLLDEIRDRHFALRVLSGGEESLGYCHSSLQQFQQQIADRARVLGPQLQQYAGILELGGTTTVWTDSAAKRDWVKENDCGRCPAATIEELQPYLELLLKSYRYNWIYGSTDGGYYAFDPHSAQRIDATLRKAQANAIRISSQ